jgi:hypothetical protein
MVEPQRAAGSSNHSEGRFTDRGVAQRIVPGQTARLDWSLENFSPFVGAGAALLVAGFLLVLTGRRARRR